LSLKSKLHTLTNKQQKWHLYSGKLRNSLNMMENCFFIDTSVLLYCPTTHAKVLTESRISR